MHKDNHPAPAPAKSPSLPGVVKFLIVLLSLLALWNGMRFGAALAFWDVLDGYRARGGPLYLALSGAFWLVGVLWTLWSVGTRRRWGCQATIGVCGGYFIWYWLDRLILRFPNPNWPFALTLSAVLLLVALGAALHPSTRRFLQEGES